MSRSNKTRPLVIRCEEDGCPKKGTAVNTISGFSSEADRAAVIEQWHAAHTDEDYCKACGILGVPDEEA